jgi:hypothetical protein
MSDQIRTIRTTASVVACLAILCFSSIAEAQQMKLGKNQMLSISPNGDVSIRDMPAGQRMPRGSKAMRRGATIMMDQNGRMHVVDYQEQRN